jgi:DNA adenine methylase
VNPPFPYFGGKQQIADQIVRVLPAHRHYVEPFCGGLSVLLAKPPSKLETVNDLDGELVTFWRVLRDKPEALERACALTPMSRTEHRQAFAPAIDDVEVARRVFIRLTQGRAARLSPSGWRRHITTRTNPHRPSGYVDRLAAASHRLRDVQIECAPALELIADYGPEPDALLYVDPPYLGSTRNGTNYRHEMPAETDHRRLAEALHAARAAVVLSGYPSDLYDRDLYADWHRTEIEANTGQGGSWGARTEVLWSNRPLGVQPSLLDALEAS